jgi:N-acetylmuramoyl-L-alanine amidase
MTYGSIAISSGHGLKVRGASGILDEVDEARKFVNALAAELRSRGVVVTTFHDDVSTSQNENLNRLTDWHNAQDRELDISAHMNAYEQTDKPMGCEVLYVTQGELAGQVSAAIAHAGGLIDRGAKYRSDLHVLNTCDEPTILLETCFVDSEADAAAYQKNFTGIVDAVADVLGGKAEGAEDDAGDTTPPKPPRRAPARVDIEASGDVRVFFNGELVSGN